VTSSDAELERWTRLNEKTFDLDTRR
jgi:hypothetical protein